MKTSKIIKALWLCLIFLSCSFIKNPLSKTGTPVAYDTYEGYSYRGQRVNSDTTFFFITTNKADFDSLYHYIFIHPPYDTIPSADLSTKKVISLVKYGNDFYKMEVKDVSLFDGILIVNYTSILTDENMTWVAAIPLILTTGADFKRVVFIENGIKIKELVIY